MKTADYATATFGKWGLGFIETPGNPLKQGFDRFYGYNCQALAHNYFPAHLWDDNKKLLLNNRPANQVQYAPDMIQKKALQFIDENSNRPFFMYLAYTLPHAALQLPKGDRHFEYYKQLFKEKPVKVNDAWNGAGYQPQPYPHAAYGQSVAAT